MINKEKLVEYKQKIEHQQNLIETMTARRAKFDEINEALIQSLKDAGENVSSLKDELRKEGLSEFEETDNKKLTGGLGVRVSHYVEYDEKAMINWCKTNMPVAVVEKLDKKVFESFALDNLVPGAEQKERTSVIFPKEINIEGESSE